MHDEQLIIVSSHSSPPSPSILTHSNSFSSISSAYTTAETIKRSRSITFAPLPTKEPSTSRSRRKKRPMGVAYRSTMLRTQYRGQAYAYDQDGFDDPDGHHMAAYPRSGSAGFQRQMQDDDDALVELGRIVVDAGKKLWRNVSSKSHRSQAQSAPTSDTPPPQPPLPPSSPSPLLTSLEDLKIIEEDEFNAVSRHDISEPNSVNDGD
ncbi:hypothetical protein SISNIDRAFT_525462 [Sistotremastrum niveocremeum HHB9708]|uniref:Uncharacterized protein n=1 Tax=Sistotremastrum niveocremeum HHB9708 TaxID=1314777 RepID=A0A164QUA5_9AGAM|nr:hypothetical protein SISNIDRAFT_525462 [Sistotremastrum niveocremeum HHB9708]